MNIRLSALSIGLSLMGFAGIAMPALASYPYSTAHYGAGFLPSPTIANEHVIPATISTANYGASFLASPTLINNTSVDTVYTANYGAGFFASPNVVRSHGHVHYGHYGAGFFVSPRPWYGYGFSGLFF